MDCRTLSGCVSLHYAAISGDLPTLAALLQHEPDLAHKSRFPAWDRAMKGWKVGTTPLHVAAARGHAEWAKQLLKHFVSGAGSAAVHALCFEPS